MGGASAAVVNHLLAGEDTSCGCSVGGRRSWRKKVKEQIELARSDFRSYDVPDTLFPRSFVGWHRRRSTSSVPRQRVYVQRTLCRNVLLRL